MGRGNPAHMTTYVTAREHRAARGFAPLCMFPTARGCDRPATSVVRHYSTFTGRIEPDLLCAEHGQLVADVVAEAAAAGIDCA